jgi:hypothetical protein
MRYDRTIIGYHGCDAETAERLLGGELFRFSENDFDWLGRGIYFWEFGADRALRFANDQKNRGKVLVPSVVGAVIQLGRCFDLLDTRFTSDLASAYESWRENFERAGLPLPKNGGGSPDQKLRRLDCAVLNWYLDRCEEEGQRYDTVRCAFPEGKRVYEDSGIYREMHVQIAVRTRGCILGVFRPQAFDEPVLVPE